jgi:Ser/Thr protein kinase RdoA (MazF antagonist)
MTTTPPHERYNQHANKAHISPVQIENAIARCGLTPSECSIRKLSGGFQNANFLVEQDRRKLVLRFYSTKKETALREVGTLQFLANHDVKTPKVIDFFELENKGVVLLEFLEGQLLQEKLIESKTIDLITFHLVGQELAKIHLIELPRTGFIGPEMQIGNEYEKFSLFLKEYIVTVFSSVNEARLEPSIRDRLLRLVEDNWKTVLMTEPASNLVHCDFNPKNILIMQEEGRPVVSGVLDWEFCISGNGYIDIGNFFRFPYDYPELAQQKFIEGYKSIKPSLIKEWKEVSLLMDLGNMASFLSVKEDYQKTFRTAREIVSRTLKYFEY